MHTRTLKETEAKAVAKLPTQKITEEEDSDDDE